MTLSYTEQIYRLVAISKLYYDEGLSQQQISEKIHIHRTEISRLLKEAKKMGIVQTIVKVPSNPQTEKMARFLRKHFSLKDVIVVPTEKNESYQENLRSLSLYANEMINHYLEDDSVVGLSWGKTLENVISSFYTTKKYKNIQIVPLIGGPLGQLDISCQANSLVSKLSYKIDNSRISTLDSPAFISSPLARKEILETQNNRNTVNLWENVNLAIVGIGSAKDVDNKNWQEFYNKKGVAEIYHKSMVGDILSQAYSITGSEYQKTYPNLVGMELKRLKEVKTTIAIATGEKKIDAILGGLRANVFNVLITTDTVAQSIKSQL